MLFVLYEMPAAVHRMKEAAPAPVRLLCLPMAPPCPWRLVWVCLVVWIHLRPMVVEADKILNLLPAGSAGIVINPLGVNVQLKMANTPQKKQR